MAKVGLKDTLRLMAAGYTKKEIDNLAAIDEENEKDEKDKKDPEPVPPAPVIVETVPAPAPSPKEKKDPEPDYKKMYEETKTTLTKLQQDNVHKDSSAAAEEKKKEQNESLMKLVRSFM